MRNLSDEFKQAILNDDRNYLVRATVELQNGTSLEFDNSTVWTGGFSIEDAVSDDNSFTALGSTIINSATLVINNIYDEYSEYDFSYAHTVLYIAKEFPYGTGTRREEIRFGTYVVDDFHYDGSHITLELLDYMVFFDVPYSKSRLGYPATLRQIVQDCCTSCGVTLQTLEFPHYSYTIPDKPQDDSVTFRDILSWAATIAGCFARFNNHGRLELKWFDKESLESLYNSLDGGYFDGISGHYNSGDTADGGSFNPWNRGYMIDSGTFVNQANVHSIYTLASQNIGIADVVITGIDAEINNETGTSYYSVGTDEYQIKITDNLLITVDNVQEIIDWLGEQLIGLQFRNLNVTHLDNPAIEAGDVALVTDRKNHIYPTLVTRTNFSVGNYQTTVSGAESPSKNTAIQYSSSKRSTVQNYVRTAELLVQEQTSREQAIENLTNALAEHAGLYSTIEQTSSGNIYYMHDLPNLDDSRIVWKMTAEAWGVSTDGGRTWNGGMTVDGDTIVRILQATGINASWITTGTLTVGGVDNTRGVIEILDNNGVRVGRWDNTGLYIGNIESNLSLPKTKITTSGEIITKSLEAQDYIHLLGAGTSTLKFPMLTGYDNVSGTLSINEEGFIGEVMPSSGTSSSFYGYFKLGIDTYPYNVGALGQSTITRLCVRLSPQKTSANSVFIIPVTNSSTYTDVPGIICKDKNNNIAEITSRGISLVRTSDATSGFGSYIHFGYGSIGVANIGNTKLNVKTTIKGTLTVSDTKSREVETSDYGNRLLYCYETPSPLFGDVGEGTISEDGMCYIFIDHIFSETISLNQYQVFLQKYGEGDCWVEDRKSAYFIVKGTPGLSFGWELKAKQIDHTQLRLDQDRNYGLQESPRDYGADLQAHIDNLAQEREVNAE